MKKITVKENEEFRVKVITDFDKNEFFYDAFIKAKKEIECIVNDTITYHRTKNDTMLDFSNNIIAFSGDRGQGKSSAMLSFSNLLNNCNKNSYNEFLGTLLSGNNYIVLDRIDPTKFEDKDNILLTILGKVFNKFCALWNNSDKNNMIQYSSLLEQFELCYEEIMTIKSSQEVDNITINALENLGRIGESGNLKNDLWKLLELFFEFENKCTNRYFDKWKNYLVIQLDDTDLNTQNAYKIVEDIRKYFMIPNVIVLMAIDISQLTKAIEQYFINKYKVFNDYYGNQYLIEHRKVAVKYIDKLIPGDRKIFLPKLTMITGKNADKVKLEYLDNSKNNILFFKDAKNEIIEDFQELIIRLIYEKTGIIFVKPKTYVHDIIPNTMRELVNFLSILNRMSNIKNNYNDLEDLNLRLENIKSFENYFVEVWIPNYVPFNYFEKTTNFITASIATKNKQLIKDLKIIISSGVNGMRDDNRESQILTKVNKIEKAEKYTLADIRTVLNAFEDEFPQEDTYKFIFAIETLYTIYLSKTICNQLIREKNDESFDIDFLDFIGGEIFNEDEINSFIRKEKGAINRGTFEILTAYNPDAQQSMEILIDNNAFFQSLFLNFSFRFYQGKLQEYKRPYKSANGVRSTKFKYDALSPIVKYLDIKMFLKRLDSDIVLPVDDTDEFNAIRYQCMRIVSNIDLVNYISKKLQDYSAMRSKSGDYHEHLINLYERLESCLKTLYYYDLNFNFDELKNQITKNKNSINKLFLIYKEVDADLDEVIIENLDKLVVYITKLRYLSNTEPVEKLKKKVSSLLKMLSNYNRMIKEDILDTYINDLKNMEENLKSSHDFWENFEYEYTNYNEIVKQLKDRFENQQED